MRDDIKETALFDVIDTVERMRPRDPIGEMLGSQTVMVHIRDLHPVSFAPQQEIVGNVRVVSQYADRTSNTFRRLMRALAA